MTLQELGYDSGWDIFRKEQGFEHYECGRVVNEHKERYIVRTGDHEYQAEIIGQLRYSAENRSDFPAVGDWVALSPYDDDKALIHAVLPRRTIISRQAVGKHAEKQIIATNVDYAFIVQAVDRDFNINRIERYLTICHSAKVNPIILLNKIDLIDQNALTVMLEELNKRIEKVPVRAISNETGEGINTLMALMLPGKTYCLLGSSGVGKSTLVNKLSGREMMETNAISTSTQKGRHITTHRELILLANGSILIDNPGMREVGIIDSTTGVDTTFDMLLQYAQNCRFKDCTHTNEAGCAVLQAVENGELDPNAHENYLKLEREREHFEMTLAEKRKRDREFGKMIKSFKKIKDHRKK